MLEVRPGRNLCGEYTLIKTLSHLSDTMIILHNCRIKLEPKKWTENTLDQDQIQMAIDRQIKRISAETEEQGEEEVPLPTYSEIQNSLEVLKKVIPEIINNSFINVVYSRTAKIKLEQTNQIKAQSMSGIIEKPKRGPYKNAKQKSSRQFKNNKQISRKTRRPSGYNDNQHWTKSQKRQTITNSPQIDGSANAENNRKVVKVQGQKRKQRKSFDLYKVWNAQHQSQFIEYYRATGNFSLIRNKLIQKYPHFEQYFTNSALRSVMFKIIRVAIRKLIHQVDHHQVRIPELMNINDNRVKAINYYQQGRSIKLQLLQLYSTKQFNKKILVKTILAVNQYISRMEKSYNPNGDYSQDVTILKRKKKKEEQAEKKAEKKAKKDLTSKIATAFGQNTNKGKDPLQDIEESLDYNIYFDEEEEANQQNKKQNSRASIQNWMEEEFK